MERESFVFYRSFYEAIENLPDELQLEAHKSILKYALDGIEPLGNNIVKAIFMLIKPQIDANNKRFIDGQKGGRPSKKTTGYENNNHSVTTKEPNVNVNVNVNENEHVVGHFSDEKAKPTPIKKFIKPSIEEIKAYCDERNNGVNPIKFFNFYESKGWKVGKNPMKDWKACVRTWEEPKEEEQPKPESKYAKAIARSIK